LAQARVAQDTILFSARCFTIQHGGEEFELQLIGVG